jgi:predicted short-subunit dehydrogenase-like oxidoreductase (DUF2520 family)
LTTPDREISGIAQYLADSKKVCPGQLFYHMSGAMPAEILKPLSEAGAQIGSLHPLQSFADIDQALSNLPGSFFALQGDQVACETALQIVKDLEGTCFKIRKQDKPLYHLGACIASNYLVTLIHSAVGVYKGIGMTPEQATAALLPLIKGTLANIEAVGPAMALTGPVARGDTGTIEKHLQALNDLGGEIEEVYKLLGLYTVKVGLEKGSLSQADAEKLRELFSEGGN